MSPGPPAPRLGVIAMSAARSSDNCPASRYLCSGSKGSLRAASTTRSPGCRAWIRPSRPSSTSGWSSTCASSMITTSGAASSRVRRNSDCARSRPVSQAAPSATPSATSSLDPPGALSPPGSADSISRQNRVGPASAAAGHTQATRASPGSEPAHSASSAVLPAPGPAHSKVSGRSAARSRSATRRARGTYFGGNCGTTIRGSRIVITIVAHPLKNPRREALAPGCQ